MTANNTIVGGVLLYSVLTVLSIFNYQFCYGYIFSSIFGDIGDYDPTESTKEYEKKEKAKEREREKDRKKSKSSSSYFDKSSAGGDEEVSTNTQFVLKVPS